MHLHIQSNQLHIPQWATRGARQLTGDERSYLPKWWAVVFMNLNNRDNVQRAVTKFVWQLGRYEPSPPSTKELHELLNSPIEIGVFLSQQSCSCLPWKMLFVAVSLNEPKEDFCIWMDFTNQHSTRITKRNLGQNIFCNSTADLGWWCKLIGKHLKNFIKCS